MENLRTALKLPLKGERSKSMHPELFARQDKSEVLKNIEKRSYAEKKELVETLKENCEGLHIDLYHAETMDEAQDITVEIIRSKSPEFSHNRHVIAHDHPDIGSLQLWKRFSRESVTLHTSYAADTDAREKTLASYIGITAPTVAVAESATLIQLTSPGCPRSTSLVPSIHVALVRASKLVASLEEGYALLEKEAPKESFVFISGPSKTADIEAHLVLGAHGPKELHLILLDDTEDEPAREDLEPVESLEQADAAPSQEAEDQVMDAEPESNEEEVEESVKNRDSAEENPPPGKP